MGTVRSGGSSVSETAGAGGATGAAGVVLAGAEVVAPVDIGATGAAGLGVWLTVWIVVPDFMVTVSSALLWSC